tara:strand:+ start:137 stop:358 length:222 start_codon:yes stop_codon:yes gene_type:complete
VVVKLVQVQVLVIHTQAVQEIRLLLVPLKEIQVEMDTMVKYLIIKVVVEVVLEPLVLMQLVELEEMVEQVHMY